MSKAVFPEKPAIRPLKGTDYVLAEDFYFPATVGGWDVVVHVAPGFRTDGASIPRLLWRVLGSPYDPDVIVAAIAHDALYRGEIVPRKDADAAFLALMEACGVAERKRRWLLRGVRWFGWITWARHTPESVAEARRYIQLAFATTADVRQQAKKKGKSKMKKPMMIALAACAAAMMTGCKSIEVDRKAQTLATVQNADGTAQVVKDAAGNPILLDGGWSVNYFQHWNWQEFDALTAKAGKAELAINNYRGGADATNLTALVQTSIDSGTKLATAIGEAYVKIAGGGAQASTVLTSAQKVYEYFTGKGGNVEKATVTTDEATKTLKVDDGTTCISCDAAGNCSDCTVK